MKTIIVRKDFGVSDISDEEDVRVILDKMDIESCADVQLDLSGCLIDYPATSKLMDVILGQLSSLPGKKNLKIITDYVLPTATVLNWLFLGSDQMGLREKKAKDDIAKAIETVLQHTNITLKLTIRDGKGNDRHELTIPTE